MINKDQFHEQIEVEGIVVPKVLTAQLLTTLKPYLKKFRSKPPVVNMHGSFNLLLVQDPKELPPQYKQYQVQTHFVKFKYEDYTMQEALQRLLPKEFTERNLIPTSFETVGHIAHLNLFPDHAPYKKLIGQVLLDKNPQIKTVVNKSEKLENIYRNPTLELIAGRPQFICELKEGNCEFKLDF